MIDPGQPDLILPPEAAASVQATVENYRHAIAYRDTLINELRNANRKLVDERDRAIDRRGEHVFAGIIYCDTGGCQSRVALTPLPKDEADLVVALQALRWSTDKGHRCPGCRR